MPRVVNRRHQMEMFEDEIYVGRPSKWGNPFRIGRDGTRAEVVRKFEDLVMAGSHSDFRDEIKAELKGKDLVCWCSPEPCHADILLRIANEEE